MRCVHEATLLLGIVCLAALMFRRTLHLPRAPHVYIAILALLFIVSLVCALRLTLRPRSTALPIRLTFSSFLAALGGAFILTAGVNDLWLPLSYPQRFALFLCSICIFFVAPWVATDFRVLGRSPVAFDASLVPFLALGLYQLDPSRFRISLFWTPEFWLVLGLPASIISYFFMRRRLRSDRGTFLPLSISTVMLYLILVATYGSIIRN